MAKTASYAENGIDAQDRYDEATDERILEGR
jgi:hypothetical protein